MSFSTLDLVSASMTCCFKRKEAEVPSYSDTEEEHYIHAVLITGQTYLLYTFTFQWKVTEGLCDTAESSRTFISKYTHTDILHMNDDDGWIDDGG